MGRIKERASHFSEILLRRAWSLSFAVIFSAFAAAITWRDELLSPETAQKWRVLNMMPHWDWGWWVLISAAVILAILIDGSFRIHAGLKETHKKDIEKLERELGQFRQQSRKLEIFFDPQSPDFVRTEYRKGSLQRVTRYSVAVHNPSATLSAQDVFLEADDSLIVENTIKDAWGNLMQSTARIDPESRWFVELFGLPEGFGPSSDQRDVFLRPQHFTLRARALDTPVATCKFEFDASKSPVLRKM